jgi:hypothetical protein
MVQVGLLFNIYRVVLLIMYLQSTCPTVCTVFKGPIAIARFGNSLPRIFHTVKHSDVN